MPEQVVFVAQQDTDGADAVTAHAGALETKDGSPDEILPARHGVRSHHELTSCRKAVERPNDPAVSEVLERSRAGNP